MTKEKIEEAYIIADTNVRKFGWHKGAIIDAVNIGIQMALNGEVVYKEDGTIQRIE
jgi:hypothetical protein